MAILGKTSKFRGNSLSLPCKDRAVYPSPSIFTDNFPLCSFIQEQSKKIVFGIQRAKEVFSNHLSNGKMHFFHKNTPSLQDHQPSTPLQPLSLHCKDREFPQNSDVVPQNCVLLGSVVKFIPNFGLIKHKLDCQKFDGKSI